MRRIDARISGDLIISGCSLDWSAMIDKRVAKRIHPTLLWGVCGSMQEESEREFH